MSKTKEWIYDTVEEKVEQISKAYKDQIITKEEAINSIMKIVGIDVYVGDEVDYGTASEILDQEIGGVYA